MSRPGQALNDLSALLIIADQGVELQDEAAAVIRACAGPDEPAVSVARRGGRVAGAYHRLWAWSLDFAPRADADSLERRLSQLLLQHCHLVHVSVRLAFPKCRYADHETRRHRAVDLEPAAAELRAIRDELQLWLSLG
jgi:hypothetical protein